MHISERLATLLVCILIGATLFWDSVFAGDRIIIELEPNDFYAETDTLSVSIWKRCYTKLNNSIWLYTIDTQEIRAVKVNIMGDTDAQNRAQNWIDSGARRVKDIEYIRVE